MVTQAERKTSTEFLAESLANPAKHELIGPTKTVSFRAPLDEFFKLQALQEQSALNKSDVVLNLVQAGMEALWAELDQETANRVQERYQELVADFIDKDGGRK